MLKVDDFLMLPTSLVSLIIIICVVMRFNLFGVNHDEYSSNKTIFTSSGKSLSHIWRKYGKITNLQIMARSINSWKRLSVSILVLNIYHCLQMEHSSSYCFCKLYG